jgi:hypothetical protein
MNMMYSDIQRTEWILLALGTGLTLVFIIILSHLEGARPRPHQAKQLAAMRPDWRLVGLALPWVIILLSAGSLVLGLLYFFYRMKNPPNW